MRVRLRVLGVACLAASAVLLGNATYIPAKAALAQVLLERAWVETQETGHPVRPWSWADITPVAEISVPRLQRRVVILGDVSGQAMAFAPGHMPNTPAIGEAGTAVVAAHRDTHFSFLGELKEGDIVLVTDANGVAHDFRVSETRIVEADASRLDPMDGGPTGARLALTTCYPFSGVLHSPLRYVVLADRVT